MKIFTGKIISTKMKNTATVLVDSTFMHKLYGKRFIRSKKYHVHDEYGLHVGDTVNFVASRPYSKVKKWKIINVKGNKKMITPSDKKEGEGTEKRAKPVIKKEINKRK